MCVSSYQRSIFFSPKERKRAFFSLHIRIYIHPQTSFFSERRRKKEKRTHDKSLPLSILSSVCITRRGLFALCCVTQEKKLLLINEEGNFGFFFFWRLFPSFEQRGNPPLGFTKTREKKVVFLFSRNWSRFGFFLLHFSSRERYLSDA